MPAFSLEGIINVSADKATRELDRVDKEIQKTGKSLEDSEKGFSKFQKTLNGLGKGMVDFGKNLTASVTAPLMALGGLSVKISSDAGEAKAKFGAVFKDMSTETQVFVDNFSKQYGRYDADIHNMMASTMAAGKNYGLSAERSRELSKELQQLTVDVGAFNDMSDTDVHERLLAALRGEGEAAEALTLSINETTLADYARRQGITKKISELTEAEKMELRYGLILEQTADMQGYATKEGDSFASSMTKLKSSLMELAEKIGDVLLPMIQPLIDKVREFAEWFGGLDGNTQKIIVFVGIAAAAIGPLLMMLGFMTMGITALGSAFSLLASPVTLIILAIMALIAVGVLLYMNWETVKAKCGECWDWIKKKFQDFNTWITNIFTTDWSKNFGVFGDILNGFFSVCGDVWNNIKSIFSNIIDFVKNVFTGNWEGAWQNIVNIFDAIVSNIANIFKIPINAVIALMNGVIGAMNKMKIKTPDWLPGELGGKEFGINIPKINYLYEGGIFNKPTLLGGGFAVGDRYNGQGNATEVVAPLEKLRQMIIDLLQVSVVLNIDGYEFVKQVVAPHQDAIDRYNSRYV